MVMRRTQLLSLPVLAALLLPSAVQAELGGAMTGVQVDRAHLEARLKSTPSGTHTLHDMTLPNGGSVREFTNANGRVYALTWSGPGKPDLRSLLGGYFARLQTDNGRFNPRARRQPLQIVRSDVVIQSGGHMGYFWGVAYVPALAPAGFSVTDLQ
jgi:Protein of unknown function (DUF2844)